MQRSRGCCHIEFGSAYLLCFRERQKKSPHMANAIFVLSGGGEGEGEGEEGGGITDWPFCG